MTDDNPETAMDRVDALAWARVERGLAKSLTLARKDIFESRPALAEAVRKESAEAFAKARNTPVEKRVVRVARDEVEKAALALVRAGKAPNITQARAAVYEEKPALAEAVRKEQAAAFEARP